MSIKKNLLVAVIAFGSGYYLNDYRHAQQQSLLEPGEIVAPSPTIAPRETPAAESPAAGAPQQTSIVQTRAAITPGAAVGELEQAQQLVATNAFEAAIKKLTDLLKSEPNNAEALLLLARVLEQQGQHQDAVATWFRYLQAEVDAQKIEEALTHLSRYLVRLVNNPAIFGGTRDWLIAQLNALIKLTPDNGELHLQLADMHLKAADKMQAQYHALMAANQENTRTRAEAFIARMTDAAIEEQTAHQELNVPLMRFGNQFLVPVSVEGEPVKLLLDTGASISGLTSAFLNRNYSLVKSPKPIQLNTASGTVDSYLFVVDNLDIAELRFSKHMLARLPMDDTAGFDGLLGVDILGRFDFVIDQQKAILRLRKRQLD